MRLVTTSTTSLFPNSYNILVKLPSIILKTTAPQPPQMEIDLKKSPSSVTKVTMSRNNSGNKIIPNAGSL